jgi:hypothetical protein
MRGLPTLAWGIALAISAALGGCDGLDDDVASEPKHVATYLLVTKAGTQQLEAVTDTGRVNPSNHSTDQLGLSNVSDLSTEGVTLAVLGDDGRVLLLRDADTWPPERVALTSLAATPTRVLLGREYALVLTASTRAYWVRRRDARLLDEVIELPWVPREGIYSKGRFYLADSSHAVAIEEVALTIRANITLGARIDTLDVPYADGVGVVTFTGRTNGQFVTASIDNLALTPFGSTSQAGLAQRVASPFIRRQFARDYLQTVSVSTTGEPSPFGEFVSLDGAAVAAVPIGRVAVDFRGSAAYFTRAGVSSLVYYRSVAGGSVSARAVLGEPVQRLHKAVHVWRLP